MTRKVSRITRIFLVWVEPELARANRLVKEMNIMLDRSQRESIRLADERDEQAKVIAQLSTENSKLQQEVHRLLEANRLQNERVDELKKRLDDMDEKYTYMMGRVMQLQVQQGMDINVPKRPIG